MATLEKIRSKSVLLIVVIGVALLAFIIGDAITNSRNLFGDHTVVAKVGGQKIDYTDYIKKREELNNRLEEARRQNPAQYANFDTQLISQMALDELVGETLLDKAASNAGIQVSSEQLRFYVMDNPVNPTMQTLIQQLNATGLAVSTPAQAYEVIFNPKRNGVSEASMAPFQRAWLAMEEETKQLVRRQEYQRLLANTVKANELDKKALYNDYVATSNVDIAFQPYGVLDDSKYPVSDQEVSAAYNDIKNQYKVTEDTKDVKFIAVNIAPSIADREASRMLAVSTKEALQDSLGQLTKELKKQGVASSHHELRAADIANASVREFVTTATPGQVEILSDGIKGFNIVKMGNRQMVTDSIQINIVNVAGEVLPAKILASLNSGLPGDSLASQFGADSVFFQSNQWIPLFTEQGRTNALDKEQLDNLYAADGKYVVLINQPQGALLAKLVKKNSPVEIVSYEEVNYDLKPSTTTVNEEREKLEKFLAENNTAKAFAENASKAGYTVQDYALSASTVAIPRIAGLRTFYPDSRQVVRWIVMDAKPGQVSHIYESKDALTPALYAAAVTAEYDDYAPLANADVKNAATDRARRAKAGDDLVKQLSGKGDINATATAMNTEAQNNPNFRFGRNAVVRDDEVMGLIAGSKPGQVVVVKGDNGVYAYQITGQTTESFPFSDQQYEQQYFQLVNPNIGEMLMGAQKYDNRIYKFEAGD